jgi:hypothetical protein
MQTVLENRANNGLNDSREITEFSMRVVTSCLLALACSLSPALAQSPSERAAAIESAMEAGDGAAAFALAQSLLLEVGASVPMGVRNATLTQEAAQGFGVYTPRADNVFQRGEPIHIYAEPFGYAYGALAGGLFEIALDVDLLIKTPEGGVLAGQDGIAQLVVASRNRATEFQATISYNLNAPIGRYLLTTVLIDRHGDDRVEFDTLIEIVD